MRTGYAPAVIDLPSLDAGPERTHRGRMRLRYDDIAQDGRAKIETLPAALGSLWMAMVGASPEAGVLRREGIVPVLRRFVLVGTDTPIAVQHALETDGRWETARSTADRTRFLMNMRVDLSGPRALTNDPQPENAGAIERVGGVYAEHVYTRLFASKDQRRVELLPEGIEVGPERPWVGLAALTRTGAEAIDAEPVPRGEVLFGLTHTDSNQHVNSLVYPRLFEAHALMAWDEGRRLMRAIDVIWQKPSFAGERATVSVQRIGDAGRIGAVATLGVEGEPRPRCAARLWLG